MRILSLLSVFSLLVATDADFKTSPVCVAGTTCVGFGVTFTGILAAQEAFHSNHKNDAASDGTTSAAPSEPSLGGLFDPRALFEPCPNNAIHKCEDCDSLWQDCVYRSKENTCSDGVCCGDKTDITRYKTGTTIALECCEDSKSNGYPTLGQPCTPGCYGEGTYIGGGDRQCVQVTADRDHAISCLGGTKFGYMTGRCFHNQEELDHQLEIAQKQSLVAKLDISYFEGTSVAVSFAGGGFSASGMAVGFIAGLVKESGRDKGLEGVFKNVDAISSNSGGSWFSSMLAYSPNMEKWLTAENPMEEYINNYYKPVDKWLQDQQFTSNFLSQIFELVLPKGTIETVQKYFHLMVVNRDSAAALADIVYRNAPLIKQDMIDKTDLTMSAPVNKWAREKALLMFSAVALSADITPGSGGDYYSGVNQQGTKTEKSCLPLIFSSDPTVLLFAPQALDENMNHLEYHKTASESTKAELIEDIPTAGFSLLKNFVEIGLAEATALLSALIKSDRNLMGNNAALSKGASYSRSLDEQNDYSKLNGAGVHPVQAALSSSSAFAALANRNMFPIEIDGRSSDIGSHIGNFLQNHVLRSFQNVAPAMRLELPSPTFAYDLATTKEDPGWNAAQRDHKVRTMDGAFVDNTAAVAAIRWAQVKEKKKLRLTLFMADYQTPLQVALKDNKKLPVIGVLANILADGSDQPESHVGLTGGGTVKYNGMVKSSCLSATSADVKKHGINCISGACTGTSGTSVFALKNFPTETIQNEHLGIKAGTKILLNAFWTQNTELSILPLLKETNQLQNSDTGFASLTNAAYKSVGENRELFLNAMGLLPTKTIKDDTANIANGKRCGQLNYRHTDGRLRNGRSPTDGYKKEDCTRIGSSWLGREAVGSDCYFWMSSTGPKTTWSYLDQKDEPFGVCVYKDSTQRIFNYATGAFGWKTCGHQFQNCS